MDRSKETIPGHALKVSVRKTGDNNKSPADPMAAFSAKVFSKVTISLLLSIFMLVLYLVPATAPSFLPSGSSSSTPHHSPLAKSVSPRNRTTPAFVPPTFMKKRKYENKLELDADNTWLVYVKIRRR